MSFSNPCSIFQSTSLHLKLILLSTLTYLSLPFFSSNTVSAKNLFLAGTFAIATGVAATNSTLYLGKADIDFSKGIQVPKADLGTTVTYLSDGSIYATMPETAVTKRGTLAPRGCFGLNVNGCCIGVYCDFEAEEPTSKRDTSYDTIYLDGDMSNKTISSLTVYPDRSMDIVLASSGSDLTSALYTCIGLHYEGCCVGICIRDSEPSA